MGHRVQRQPTTIPGRGVAQSGSSQGVAELVEGEAQQEGGYNQGVHLLPGRVKAGRIVLKGGLTRSKEMLKWYQDVVTGKLEAAKKQIDVVMYDSQGAALMTLTFAQAYPVKWTGPSFRASESAIAIETLELAFSEVTVS